AASRVPAVLRVTLLRLPLVLRQDGLGGTLHGARGRPGERLAQHFLGLLGDLAYRFARAVGRALARAPAVAGPGAAVFFLGRTRILSRCLLRGHGLLPSVGWCAWDTEQAALEPVQVVRQSRTGFRDLAAKRFRVGGYLPAGMRFSLSHVRFSFMAP